MDGLSVSQTMGFMNEEGNGAGVEEVVLRSSSQARSEGGIRIVIEALNFERRSLPRIEMGYLGNMRKQWKMRYLEVCKVEAWLFVV